MSLQSGLILSDLPMENGIMVVHHFVYYLFRPTLVVARCGFKDDGKDGSILYLLSYRSQC